MPELPFELPSVIAHRGAPLVAPENTLAALRIAQDLGVTWVEFDVQLIHSGEVVVFHDARVDRTTNGQGPLKKFNYAELSTLDAGSWFNPAFSNERIPLLQEWLTLAKERQLGLNIEFKPTRLNAKKLVQKTLQLLTEYWDGPDAPPLLLSSFSHRALAHCCQQAPQRARGLLTSHWLHFWQDAIDRYQCSALHIDYNALTAARVAEIKAQGVAVVAYTVNDAQTACQLLADGVDAVISDNPTLLSNDSASEVD